MLPTVISMHGSGLVWAIQKKVRWDKTTQDVLCQPDKKKRMSPGFEKYCAFTHCLAVLHFAVDKYSMAVFVLHENQQYKPHGQMLLKGQTVLKPLPQVWNGTLHLQWAMQWYPFKLKLDSESFTPKATWNLMSCISSKVIDMYLHYIFQPAL